MSDTALSPANRWLFPGWVIFAAVNTAAMFAVPGQETIPFHFIYISMALVYGLQPWPLRKTYAILGVVAATTGAALAWHVKNNAIGWEETAEIPLMAVLFLVMVWHVRRRVAATIQARRYADSEHDMREMQKRFVRFASQRSWWPIVSVSRPRSTAWSRTPFALPKQADGSSSPRTQTGRVWSSRCVTTGLVSPKRNWRMSSRASTAEPREAAPA
jgi:hypothetical protein